MTTAFWIADQPGYVDEAHRSLETFKQHNPACQTVLFGESRGGFDQIIPLPPRQSEHWYLDSVNYFRLALHQLHAEQRLIYFDTDTCTLAPLDDLIQLIGRFDLIGAHAPARQTAPSAIGVPDAFCELNIGVIGIHNTPKMALFCAAWLNLYRKFTDRYGNNDQAPLRDALWLHSEMRVYVMPPEYNCRFGFGGFAAMPVKVLHGRGLDYEEAARLVNFTQGMRAWTGRDLHERV